MKTQRLLFLSNMILIVGIVMLGTTDLQAQEDEKDVPYVPTPKPVVEKMLDLADVKSGDYVIDLGSGDGRIVIQSARRGADGHGIEIDPSKIREARANAQRAGVDDQVRFLEQDLFKSDISRASVVTLYLLPSINLKLRSILMEQLEPGSRVVSHRFDMKNWKPDRQITIENKKDEPGFLFDRTTEFTVYKKNHEVYYWVIPADVQGSWSWEADGHQFELAVNQKFQVVQLNLSRDGESIQVDKANLHGKRLRFQAETRQTDYLFNGRVEGNTIEGMLQIRDGNKSTVKTWDAYRD